MNKSILTIVSFSIMLVACGGGGGNGGIRSDGDRSLSDAIDSLSVSTENLNGLWLAYGTKKGNYTHEEQQEKFTSQESLTYQSLYKIEEQANGDIKITSCMNNYARLFSLNDDGITFNVSAGSPFGNGSELVATVIENKTIDIPPYTNATSFTGDDYSYNDTNNYEVTIKKVRNNIESPIGALTLNSISHEIHCFEDSSGTFDSKMESFVGGENWDVSGTSSEMALSNNSMHMYIDRYDWTGMYNGRSKGSENSIGSHLYGPDGITWHVGSTGGQGENDGNVEISINKNTGLVIKGSFTATDNTVSPAKNYIGSFNIDLTKSF